MTETHELTIDRYGGDAGDDVIASCSCGWLDDECRSPSDAVRRFDDHCDSVFFEQTFAEAER